MELLDRVIAGSIAAAVGAFSAYIFNRFNWEQQTLNNSILSIEEDFLESLKEFVDNCIRYWSDDQINLDQPKFIEANIKMSYMNLAPQFSQIVSLSGKFDAGTHEFIRSSIEDLFELATGGDFESSRRVSSTKRCTKIFNICNKVRVKLRKAVHS